MKITFIEVDATEQEVTSTRTLSDVLYNIIARVGTLVDIDKEEHENINNDTEQAEL